MKAVIFIILYCLPVQIFASNLATFVGHSFTLTSTISVIDFNGEVQNPAEYTSRVTENYSADQERAKLNFQIIDKPNATRAGIFYYDLLKSTAIIFNSEIRDCSKSDAEEMKLLLGISHLNFLRDESVAPSYVIGTARLLYLIQKRKKDLIYQMDHKLVNVRNIQTKLYTLEVDFEFKMAIYFEKDDPLLEVPLQVHLSSSKVSLQIFFSRYAILLDGTQLSESKLLVMKSDAQLDQFAFPPLTSCIHDLHLTKMLCNMKHELGSFEKTKFSFRSIIKTRTLKNSAGEQPLEFKLSPTVAYDSGVDVLKIDEDEGSRRKRKIINFKFDRVFQAAYSVGYAGEQSDENCVISMAPIRYPLLSTILLLFGSESFVYLGKTRLRGLGAKLYGTSRGSLPKWLEQPVIYKNRLKYEERRPDSGNALTLLYLSDTPESVPILMEVTQYYTKHTIEFFNFQWDLDHAFQASDHFSTFDLCSDRNEKHTNVELIIEALSNKTQLQHSILERNLAVMASLQNVFYLPVNMVHDMETKVITSSELSLGMHLLVTFRVVTQKTTMTELNYLGQAKQNPFNEAPSRVIPARTFYDCLELVGLKNIDAHFGYNARKRQCVIDDSKSNLPVAMRTPSAFLFSKTQPIEVYLLKHIPDETVYLRDINARWNHEQTSLKFIRESLHNKLPIFSDQGIVKNLHIMPLDDGVVMPTNVSEANLVGISSQVFHGYGLGKTENNRLVSPTAIGSHNWGPLSSNLDSTAPTKMSLEQCQATCLADFRCQSFSICFRNYDVECIISRFNFRIPSVVAQIKSDEESRTKKLTVTLEDSQRVELLKHPNCELHNKLYLELYIKKTSLVKQSVSKRVFKQTGSREECAEFCMRRNLDILRLDVGLAKNYSSLFGPESSSIDLQENHEELDKIQSNHKKISSLFCKVFYYIEYARIKPEEVKEIKKRLLHNDDEDQIEDLNGYCAFDFRAEREAREEQVAVSDNKLLMYINSEEYRFKVDLLYEKQVGIRLVSSDMTKEEVASYKRIDNHAKDVSVTDFSTIRTLVELGDNFQYITMVVSESTCAINCFLRNLGPWPLCRSFDIVKDHGRTETICQLNSVTLHQAIATHRFDLIDNNSSKLIQIWHYEPRAGYTLEDSPFEGIFQTNEEQSYMSSKLFDFISVVLLLSAMIFAKVSGIFIGVLIARTILNTKEINKQLLPQENHHPPKTRALTEITFENISLE